MANSVVDEHNYTLLAFTADLSSPPIIHQIPKANESRYRLIEYILTFCVRAEKRAREISRPFKNDNFMTGHFL